MKTQSVEMEVREAEKIVIAKPVPSRPSSSCFRTFSELLASAINASPSDECSPIVVTAIRPKAWRFKPVVDRISAEADSSETEISEAAACVPSDMILESDRKSDLVYNPTAKFVPETTVSVLANPGSSNPVHHQEKGDIEAHGGSSLPISASKLRENYHIQSEREKPLACSKPASENLEEARKSLLQSYAPDRLSYDGYNWRKYGQKKVKGSECFRSYYKCTDKDCPVKKKVERTPEDRITEIVYEGEHNHPKPEPFKRGLSQRLAFESDATGSVTNNPRLNNQLSDFGKENEVGSSCHSTHSSTTPSFYVPVMVNEFFAGSNAADNSLGGNEDCDEVSNRFKAGGDRAKGKRRRNENRLDEVEISKESTKDPCMIVRNQSDAGIVGDGFHWRKYGSKVVKGNTYPRNYYRCATPKCNVRKYVERTSDEPGAVFTKYEGRHNHDMPKHHKHKFGGGI